MSSSDQRRLDKRYFKALAFAAELHDGQRRKGTQIHYLSHLLSVSALVMEHGGSDDESIAALLHDSLEDQGDHYVSRFEGEPKKGRAALKRDLKLWFGEEVLDTVQGCTDDEDHITGVRYSRDGGVEAWRKRKKAYLRRLRSTENPSKIRVSLADKLHNARSILLDSQEQGPKFWNKFNAPYEDQVWYYGGLSRIFSRKGEKFADAGIKRMSRELERVIAGFSNAT
jgi:(p)ppGpp synthase/HD superfamily hydrolase